MHWILTRNDNNQSLKLHPQFIWRDEYDWTALAQSAPVYTLTGAMDIQQGTKKAGRPITLSGEKAWIERQIIEQLQEWSSIPELVMSLDMPSGARFDVIFNRPALFNINEIKPMRPADRDFVDKFSTDIGFLCV